MESIRSQIVEAPAGNGDAAPVRVRDGSARSSRVANIEELSRAAGLDVYYQVHSHRRILGAAIDAVKRLIHWGSRPYTDVVRERQAAFNGALVPRATRTRTSWTGSTPARPHQHATTTNRRVSGFDPGQTPAGRAATDARHGRRYRLPPVALRRNLPRRAGAGPRHRMRPRANSSTCCAPKASSAAAPKSTRTWPGKPAPKGPPSSRSTASRRCAAARRGAPAASLPRRSSNTSSRPNWATAHACPPGSPPAPHRAGDGSRLLAGGPEQKFFSRHGP